MFCNGNYKILTFWIIMPKFVKCNWICFKNKLYIFKSRKNIENWRVKCANQEVNEWTIE